MADQKFSPKAVLYLTYNLLLYRNICPTRRNKSRTTSSFTYSMSSTKFCTRERWAELPSSNVWRWRTIPMKLDKVVPRASPVAYRTWNTTSEMIVLISCIKKQQYGYGYAHVLIIYLCPAKHIWTLNVSVGYMCKHVHSQLYLLLDAYLDNLCVYPYQGRVRFRGSLYPRK